MIIFLLNFNPNQYIYTYFLKCSYLMIICWPTNRQRETDRSSVCCSALFPCKNSICLINIWKFTHYSQLKCKIPTRLQKSVTVYTHRLCGNIILKYLTSISLILHWTNLTSQILILTRRLPFTQLFHQIHRKINYFIQYLKINIVNY